MMNSTHSLSTLFLIISLMLAAVSSAPTLSDQENQVFSEQAKNNRRSERAKSDFFQNELYRSYNRLLQLVIITIVGALVGLSSAQLYVHSKHKYDYLGDVYLSSLPQNGSVLGPILPPKALPSLKPPSPASLFLLLSIMLIISLLAILLVRRLTTTKR